jgi:hypothetical protein
MAAAFHRDQQAVLACEIHSVLNVLHARRLHHKSRMLVERRVGQQSRGVVPVLAGEQHIPAQSCGEVFDVLAVQRDLATVAGDGCDIGRPAVADCRVQLRNSRNAKRRT